jgi:hypothetical protein
LQSHAQSDLGAQVLDPHLQAELDRYYWESDEPTEVLARHFDLALPPPGRGPRRVSASTRLAEFVTPMEASSRCPGCDKQLVYLSRADRRDDQATCLACGHRDPAETCECERCAGERIERAEQRYRYWRRSLCKPEYARFALDELDRDATLTYWALCYLVSRGDGPISWEDARTLTGMRDVDGAIERLARAHLLFLHDGHFELNALEPTAVQGTPVEGDAWRPFATAVQHGRAPDGDLVQLLDHVIPGFSASASTADDRTVETALDEAAASHPDLVTRAVREATRRYVNQAHVA